MGAAGGQQRIGPAGGTARRTARPAPWQAVLRPWLGVIAALALGGAAAQSDPGGSARASTDRKTTGWHAPAARAEALRAQAGPPAAVVSPAALATGPARPDDTDRLIVRFRAGAADLARPGALLARSREALDRRGLAVAEASARAQGAVLVRLDRRVALGSAVVLARELAAADPAIDSVEPDRRVQPHGLPTDPRLPEQWHLGVPSADLGFGAINLPAAWEQSSGLGVVVAVLDTGVRAHADLAGNLLPGQDFISDTSIAADGGGRDADPADTGNGVAANECGEGQSARNSLWHGTHVAGSIAALGQNGSGGVGVAYSARLLPVRVMGKCGGYLSDVADALLWAAGAPVAGVAANAFPARVINLSMGMPGACGPTLQAAIHTARARGAVVVVSAGNAGGDVSQVAPANCQGVIAVTAVDRQGRRAFYANSGSAVTLAAPGGDMRSAVTNGILSTYNAGTLTPGADTMGYLQGTSMAAPLVSGVAALMLARNPTLTPDELEARLRLSARAFPAPCSGCGAGLLDAAAAVDAAAGVSASAGAAPASLTSAPAGATAWTVVAEREPNNALATAQPISGEAVRLDGALHADTDVDHVRVAIGAGRTLQVQLSPLAEIDLDLALISDAGQLLATRATRHTQGETLQVRNVHAGAATVIYLRVSTPGGIASAEKGRYQLRLVQ